MNTLHRCGILLAALFVASPAIGWAKNDSAKDNNVLDRLERLEAIVTDLRQANARQEAEIARLRNRAHRLGDDLATVLGNPVLALGPYVSLRTDTINLVRGPHVIFEGVNVHVRSGSGSTLDGIDVADSTYWPLGSPNGLGNLIVGYDEVSTTETTTRTGSHCLVVGIGNSFTTSGGVVFGTGNTVGAIFASVTGGSGNVANGMGSSIAGGAANTTTSDAWQISIAGGANNVASGWASSIGGGFHNVTGPNGCQHICGGQHNTAEAWASCVTGGWDNHALGNYSNVTGGQNNIASETAAVVTGGTENQAQGWASSVTGGRQNTAIANGSTVSGGESRAATGDSNWVAGSLIEAQ